MERSRSNLVIEALANDITSADGAEIDPRILRPLERFADLIDEIRSSLTGRKPVRPDWEGIADEKLICRWSRLTRKFRYAVRDDRPPFTMVVRLEHELNAILREICKKPKKVLRRNRELISVNRIQEMDSSCLSWATRQPGRTLVEKAGEKRKMLAIQRRESSDTLENRVLLSLIRRCQKFCREYLTEYAEQYQGHRRIRRVVQFQKLLKRLLEQPFFHGVAPLRAIPKPNYVLLHDDRYRKVWKAYLEVSRRERRRQLLVTHRKSVYTDLLVLAMQETLSQCSSNDGSKENRVRFDAALNSRVTANGFFVPRYPPPCWSIGSHEVFFGRQGFAPGEHFQDSSSESCRITMTTRRHDSSVWRSRTAEVDFERGASGDSLVLRFSGEEQSFYLPLKLFGVKARYELQKVLIALGLIVEMPLEDEASEAVRKPSGDPALPAQPNGVPGVREPQGVVDEPDESMDSSESSVGLPNIASHRDAGEDENRESGEMNPADETALVDAEVNGTPSDSGDEENCTELDNGGQVDEDVSRTAVHDDLTDELDKFVEQLGLQSDGDQKLGMFDDVLAERESPEEIRDAIPLVEDLFKSRQYTMQRSKVRRVRVTAQQVSEFLHALTAADGITTNRALARVLGMPVDRIGGFVSQIRRLLNVDGADILTVQHESESIELNEALLRLQFGLDE